MFCICHQNSVVQSENEGLVFVSTRFQDTWYWNSSFLMLFLKELAWQQKGIFLYYYSFSMNSFAGRSCILVSSKFFFPGFTEWFNVGIQVKIIQCPVHRKFMCLNSFKFFSTSSSLTEFLSPFWSSVCCSKQCFAVVLFSREYQRTHSLVLFPLFSKHGRSVIFFFSIGRSVKQF